MSYDLLVFDPASAPRDRDAFKAWYHQETDWSKVADSSDPATTSAMLRDWYDMMRHAWPNMQFASDEEIDDPKVTGYSFGHGVIYLDFRWTVAEEAYESVRQAAVELKVGFYDVSGDEGDGEIYFPGDALRPPSDGAWRNVAADFRKLEGKQ